MSTIKAYQKETHLIKKESKEEQEVKLNEDKYDEFHFNKDDL